MSASLFPPAGKDHGGGEEGDAVEVAEDDGQSSVEAEQLHRTEVGDRTNPER